MTTNDEIRAKTVQIRALVAQAQADRCPWDATVPTYQASMATIMDHDIGPLVDVANEIDGLLVDAPPAPPVPPMLQGFGGTYAGHGLARDLYLGTDPDSGEWGAHWGRDVLAPGPGRVEAYSFPTPLASHIGAPAGEQGYAKRHADLFDIHEGSDTHGFVCYTLFRPQAMSIAVYWPDTPITLSNGARCVAMWFGHVKADIPVGRVNAGGRICTSWCSGIDFERDGVPALASHIHCCGSTTGTLSPNGDVDGFLVATALGWQVRNAGTIPGPTDYMTGQFRAGKPLSAWAGRQLPPPPQ